MSSIKVVQPVLVKPSLVSSKSFEVDPNGIVIALVGHKSQTTKFCDASLSLIDKRDIKSQEFEVWNTLESVYSPVGMASLYRFPHPNNYHRRILFIVTNNTQHLKTVLGSTRQGRIRLQGIIYFVRLPSDTWIEDWDLKAQMRKVISLANGSPSAVSRALQAFGLKKPRPAVPIVTVTRGPDDLDESSHPTPVIYFPNDEGAAWDILRMFGSISEHWPEQSPQQNNTPARATKSSATVGTAQPDQRAVSPSSVVPASPCLTSPDKLDLWDASEESGQTVAETVGSISANISEDTALTHERTELTENIVAANQTVTLQRKVLHVTTEMPEESPVAGSKQPPKRPVWA